MKEQLLNFIYKYTNKETTASERYYLKKKNLTLSHKKVNKFQFDIESLKKERDNLKNEIEFINESIKDSHRQALIKETIKLEKSKISLQDSKRRLLDDINKLTFQREMLKNEIAELENRKDNIISKQITNTITLEYIDNLPNGIEFEHCFANILQKLHYSNIEVTSGSGDFGIDILATKDDILYGFQCKLYSNTVGNEAVQEAYSGKKHYNCNIAIVVTNNYFSEQAITQARETQVILWDRNILKNKLKNINK